MLIDGSSTNINIYIKKSYFLCKSDNFVRQKIIANLMNSKFTPQGSAIVLKEVDLFDSNENTYVKCFTGKDGGVFNIKDSIFKDFYSEYYSKTCS